MTEKMQPPGTTDGTIQRLEAKIKRLERLAGSVVREKAWAYSRGLMEGMRRGSQR